MNGQNNNYKRTKAEINVHLNQGLDYIIELSPSKREFYKWYGELAGVGVRQVAKDYIKILGLYNKELSVEIELKRANRILRLEAMLRYLDKTKIEIDPEKLVPMQLSIEKQIAMLEGLNQISTKVEHSGVIEAPLFGITTTEDNEIHKDEDGKQDTAAPE